jgi:hypothetical protein
MKTSHKKIPNRNKNANMRFVPLLLQFTVVGILSIYRELFAYAFYFGCGGVAGAGFENREVGRGGKRRTWGFSAAAER